MTPAPFSYARPGSVAETLALLAAHGDAARLLAGGQSLMPLLVQRLVRPHLVIDINAIPDLDRIEILPSHIRMGALVRLEQARRAPVVADDVAVLAAALAYVANPVVRRRGTVVGNLVMNAPGAELTAVAVALEASFVVRYPDGSEATLPAAALLGAGASVPSSALVTHVMWPRSGAAGGFYEVSRRDGHSPIVAAAVSIQDGVCRAGLSGLRARALRCPGVARLVDHAYPAMPPLEDLAEALHGDLDGGEGRHECFHADLQADAAYRRDVAPHVLLRAVAQALAPRERRPEWKH